MISAPNRVHCLSNADLHEATDEGDPVNLLAEMNRRGLKPTCATDDGSDAGPWIEADAAEIDGDHPIRIRASRDLTHFERETT